MRISPGGGGAGSGVVMLRSAPIPTLHATNATVDLGGAVVASVAVSGSLKGSGSGGVVLTLTTRPASSQVETSGGAVVRNP